MTPQRRLLSALACALAPARAARLLARLADPAPELLRAEVARLAAAPRADRLAALRWTLGAAGDGAAGARLRIRLATPAELAASPGAQPPPTAPRPVDRPADGPSRSADRSRGLFPAGWQADRPSPGVARPVESDPS